MKREMEWTERKKLYQRCWPLLPHPVTEKTADRSAAKAPRGAAGSQYGTRYTPDARGNCNAFATW